MSRSKRRGSCWSPAELLSGAICLQGLGGASVIVWGSQPGALQLLLPARVTSYLILTDLTNVHYLTVSVGEKFGSNLAVWFWLRIAR